MYVSAREKLIIEVLIDRREEVTIKELSAEIDVSSRTIHRDLDKIEKILQTYHLELVRKAGVGIQIIGTAENKEEVKRTLNTSTFRDYTVDERQTMILCILFESAEPVKLFALANELRVTIATVSSDLLRLEEQVKPFKLSIVKKRGYGITISGSEKAKRSAMSYVIAKTLKEEAFFSLIKEQIQQKSMQQASSVSERLLGLVDREKVLIIEDVMHELHPVLPFSITDSAYVGLIVHLALAIERIMLGENIQMDQVYVRELQQEPEFRVAQQITAELVSRFQLAIPEAETGYITMHLQGAKLRSNEGNSLESSNVQTVLQAKKLMRFVEQKTGDDLVDNESLLDGLITHLKPAIYRIRQNMGITNPLLHSIRKDYEDLFQIVKEAAEEVFPELHVPDEEIGYLVLHFGSALLGLQDEGDLTAYIVCSSGIGTSKMLATRLQGEVREIAEIVNVSLFELHELPISDRDLVISTIHLQQFPGEYMLVSPFITPEEIQQVQLYARRKRLVKKTTSTLTDSDSTVDDIIGKMRAMRLYTEATAELLVNFHLSQQQGDASLTQCIRDACEELVKRQLIGEAESVAEALFTREAMGGLGIPGTTLALFHTRHEQVLKPSFSIQALQQPVVLKGMDGTGMEVRQILLLLSPEPYHERGLEVLSAISALIIENEESIALFESNQQAHIHAYIARKLNQFIDEKLI